MPTPNRANLLSKTHKVLKKHYKPVPLAERPVLEQMLFACCLENAKYEPAEQAFAALVDSFFDWNEVRVSSVKELAEVVHMLPDPAAAATNLKRVLQSAFETTYSFDLEALKKQNLGQAIQKLKKFEGSTGFVIGVVTQTALSGHAIPLDRGALDVLTIVGAADPKEVAAGAVAGLERAIPKNKGVEFGSLLHQLGADLVASPFSPAVHKILLEIAPDAKDRLPKRQAKKPPAPVKEEKPAAPAPAKGAPPVAEKKSADKKSAADAKKPAADKKKPTSAKPLASAKKSPVAAKKKSVAAGLAKKKPR
jgi:endonuclease-3